MGKPWRAARGAGRRPRRRPPAPRRARLPRLLQRLVVRVLEELLHVVAQREVEVQALGWDGRLEPLLVELLGLTRGHRARDGRVDHLLERRAFAISPASSASSIMNATARPLSSVRKDSPWSFALMMFILMLFSSFILRRSRSEVVPAVVTTFLPSRSGKSLTGESFFASRR